MTPTRILGSVLLALALAACNRQGPDAPKPVADKPAADAVGEGVQPVMVSPDAAAVGTEVDEAGEITAPVREFQSGQKVYISVPTKYGRKVGDKLDIFWFHDDGRSRKDDKKPIEGPFTVFEFAPTDAGLYHVEVDANGRPIALVEFEVK